MPTYWIKIKRVQTKLPAKSYKLDHNNIHPENPTHKSHVMTVIFLTEPPKNLNNMEHRT